MSETVEELRRTAADIVERAKRAGATAAEAYVRQGVETEISVRNGEVETLVEGGPKSVGLRLWRGDRSASTYATDFSEASIARLIGDTMQLAAITDRVPEAALVDRDRLATEFPDLDLLDPAVRALPAAEKLEMVRAAEAAAMAFDPRITASAGAGYGDLVMAHALATSDGFCAGYEESYVSIHVQVIADDAGGKKRNGSWFSFGRHVAQLDDPAKIGRIAGERTVTQLGAGPIATCRLPVVFDPRMAGSLVGTLFSVIVGGAIERRASFLVDKLGTRIGSDLVTIVDDPTLVRGPGSRPFDGEGQPARRTVFVEDGVLKSYALNSFNARKLGMAPTGHSSRPASGSPGETSSNLYLRAGDATPESLVAGVEYGLYCESMMGFGFNGATGDFSRGASGRLIENGKLTRPVSEVTLSANFADILGRIDGVANDLTFDRSTTAPTVRVSEMTLSGT